MIFDILFAVTFVFGVIQLLTKTIFFDTSFNGIIETLWPTKIKSFFKWVDVLFFVFCLLYQSFWWMT